MKSKINGIIDKLLYENGFKNLVYKLLGIDINKVFAVKKIQLSPKQKVVILTATKLGRHYLFTNKYLEEHKNFKKTEDLYNDNLVKYIITIPNEGIPLIAEINNPSQFGLSAALVKAIEAIHENGEKNKAYMKKSYERDSQNYTLLDYWASNKVHVFKGKYMVPLSNGGMGSILKAMEETAYTRSPYQLIDYLPRIYILEAKGSAKKGECTSLQIKLDEEGNPEKDMDRFIYFREKYKDEYPNAWKNIEADFMSSNY